MILIKQRRINECQSKALYKKVLQKTYEFLIKFVRRSPENQIELMHYIQTIFYDDMDHGVGAAQLIGEIVVNNPEVSTMNMQSVIKKMVDLLDGMSLDSAMKSTYMKYLGHFMKSQSKLLVQNQNDIIT